MFKKKITITGMPVSSVITGQPAYIQESSGLRRTSMVIRVKKATASEIRFETINSHYRLHMQSPFGQMEASK